MSLSIQISNTPLPSGQPVDTDALNALVRSLIINLQGSVDASIVADNSLSGAKLTNSTVDLDEKAVANSLTSLSVADGGLQARNLKADSYWYGAATLSGGVYGFSLAADTEPEAYAAGQIFVFKADVANTGAVDVNVSSIGAENLYKMGSQELGAGDIVAGQVCVILYDGANFQLLNPTSQATEKFVVFSGSQSASGIAFTVNTTSNQITATSHGMSSGQAFTVITDTTLPGGLSHTTAYYANVVNANTITAHTTYADSLTGANPVDITTAGTGNHKLYWISIFAQQGVDYVIRTPGASATTAPTAGEYFIKYKNSFGATRHAVSITAKANATNKMPMYCVLDSETASAAGRYIKITQLDCSVSPPTLGAANFNEVHFRAVGV